MVTTFQVLKENHTAVITGASSGIGRTAAMECALKGMHVWLIDIDGEELEQAKADVMADVKAKVEGVYVDQVSK